MTEVKANGLCGQHGTHCKAIEYLEKGQDEINRDIRTKTDELKDARRSLKHDLERFEDAIRKGYVPRSEFMLTQKLVYGLVALILADVIRRVVS